MHKTILLLAIIAAFTITNIATAGQGAQTPCPTSGPVVDCQAITVGNLNTATVTIGARLSQSPTTALAIGVWSSLEVAAPVNVNYNVTCAHPGNNRAGSFNLLAGRFVSDAAYIWVGSPAIAGPWLGWDSCETTIVVSQAGNGLVDHSIQAWVASHR